MKIVLATGSSGGHLYPAIELGEELRHRGHQVIFIGTLGKYRKAPEQRGFEYEVLLTQGLVGKNMGERARGLWLMAGAFCRALNRLAHHRPQVVVGFGGHGSFAVVLAARCRNIPTMIHEQNVVPGATNVWLSKIVRKIAISFENTGRYFKTQKIVLTGCPTPLKPSSKSSEQILSAWGLQPDRKTILVFGGSQGAHRINEVYREAVAIIAQSVHVQTIHITGEKDVAWIRDTYRDIAHPSAVFSFLNEMAEAYGVSDLVICRSGAMTVTELALFNKRAILIPYPHANAHQYQNAQALAETQLARIIEEKNLNARNLSEAVIDHMRDDRKLVADGIFFKDSSQRLADAALSLI